MKQKIFRTSLFFSISLVLILVAVYFTTLINLGLQHSGIETNQLIMYVIGLTGFPLDIKLTVNEIAHMNDVRSLYLLSYLIFIFAFIYLYKNKRHLTIRVIAKSCLLNFLIALFTSISFIRDFNYAFSQFHGIFFPQGNWRFPIDSALLKIFPIEFFTQSLTILVIIYVLEFLALIIWIKRK